MSEALTGKALLQLAKTNKNTPAAQLAREAGYIRTSRDGSKELPDVNAFKSALLEASGLQLVSGKATRSSAYETTVHQSGVLLVGYNYVRELGVGPGDVFQIVPGTDAEGEPQLVLRLVERVEGSPLPAKQPQRKPKAKAAAEGDAASTEEVDSEVDGDEEYTDEEGEEEYTDEE